MILIWMIAILLIGGALCWIAGKLNPLFIKWTALISTLAVFIVQLNLYWKFKTPQQLNSTWLLDYNIPWIPSFGINFHLALDGLSMLLVLLTGFLGILGVLCSWSEIKEKIGFYYFNLLWTLAGITGVFLALDLFLFYFFWELMLIPMFFLIIIWGDKNRKYAAYKFFIFTQAGGLLMLLSILAIYFINAKDSGVFTFDYFQLLDNNTGFSGSGWILFGFMMAFLIKLPAVPFHNWLPDAHGEAPTAGSLILAGLLLKTGAYGILRIVLPLFPSAAQSIATIAMTVGAIGIIYGAFLAYGQRDLKRLIAYTSVSHMGFVLVGVFSFREIALNGVVMQLLTHGISTGALFAMAGMLKERLHTRDIEQMGGLWTPMSSMGGLAMVFTMASLGLPMLGNFIAEFLILNGAFAVNTTITIISSLGLIFAAIYSLRFMQKVFLGPLNTDHAVIDLNTRELIILGALCVSIIVLGLFPQPVLDFVRTAITLNTMTGYE